MKKKVVIGIVILCTAFITATFFRYDSITYFFQKTISIEKVAAITDKDNDGILDMDDIVVGARNEVANRTKYKSAYYSGGYPPENEGVCTDVIWRALESSGYDLKHDIDEDILRNPSEYNGVEGKPDSNIDFRRVKNQYVYFKRYAEPLTLEVRPFDVENLKQWQGGDIVVMENGEHIAIVSDKRRRDGIPYIIHNT